MPGDAVDVQAGAEHSPAAGHDVIQAGIADHHPVDPAGRSVLEEGLRAAERTGVLIDVEQQHDAA
jgi:hypothetical protein